MSALLSRTYYWPKMDEDVSYLKPYHEDREDSERNKSKRAPQVVRKRFDDGIVKITDHRRLEGAGVPHFDFDEGVGPLRVGVVCHGPRHGVAPRIGVGASVARAKDRRGREYYAHQG
ncbi:unnamed protein product [Dovyalis caffra]|uniref:Integrase zinc-binding domain-containing protein n=1 Tax=Dovyalis caffra TaxID=77055 RepID=A0AAV1RG35_9ROSI|nr:unnamed protein product [Dovyalis caffra]